MSVEQYQLESLERRVKAIEDARHKEQMDRIEEQRKRSERSFYVTMAVYWGFIIAAGSAAITVAVVGD
jgi:hypothetical protein